MSRVDVAPFEPVKFEGQDYDTAFGHAVEICRAVSQTCGELGIVLAIEPLGPDDTNFLNTSRETLGFIDAVGHPACRLQLDARAMCSEDRKLTDIIREAGPTLAHFHANDANLRGPGLGDLDFTPILAALTGIRYTGYISVQVFNYESGGPAIARRCLEYLRRLG